MAQTKTSLANLALQHLGEGPAPAFIVDIDADTSKGGKLILNCLENCRQYILRAHIWNNGTSRVKIVAKTVTGAADNGAGLVRITAVAHGFITGDYVTVDAIQGTTEANGQWTITRITADTFDLQASTFTNTYSSGGYAGLAPAYEFLYKHALPTDFIRLVSIDQAPEFEVESGYIVTDENTLYVKYIKDLWSGSVTDYSKMDPQCFLALSLHVAWSICYAITQSSKLREELGNTLAQILARARHVDSTESSQKTFTATEWDESRLGVDRPSRNPLR